MMTRMSDERILDDLIPDDQIASKQGAKQMLMTKALEGRFAQVGRQENVADPIVIAKFFYPYGAGSWYALEYSPDTREFFGYVAGLGTDELGYFSLDEFENLEGPAGAQGIERDYYWHEVPLSQVQSGQVQ